MRDRYIITQNVTGTFKLGLRNICEAALIACTMGLLIVYGTSVLPMVMRGTLFVFFCLVPTVLAVTGIYSMTLFQFVAVQTRRVKGMNFLYRYPTEEEFDDPAAKKKKKPTTKEGGK